MKLLIVGYSCSGKTYFSVVTAKKMSVAQFHIDDVFYDYSTPVMTKRDEEDVKADVLSFLSENESWVIDGGYDRTGLYECCEAADRIIFMKMNKIVRMRNLHFRYKNRKKLSERAKMIWKCTPWILKKGCGRKYDEESFSCLKEFPHKVTVIKTLRGARQLFNTDIYKDDRRENM